MEYLMMVPVIVFSMIAYEVICLEMQKRLVPRPTPAGPKPVLANLLSELDLLIDLEILGVVEVPMMVKEIPLITNFQETQVEVIRNVTDSLSSSFFLEANRCGVKKKYILTYVTRRTHAKLLEFMKEHNLSLK